MLAGTGETRSLGSPEVRNESELAGSTVRAVEDDVRLGVDLQILMQDRHRPIDRAAPSYCAALLATQQRVVPGLFLRIHRSAEQPNRRAVATAAAHQ